MADGRTDLGLGQVELTGQLGPLPPHHVLTPLELHLQPVQLLRGEGGPGPFGPVQVQTFGQDDLPDGTFSICSHQQRSVSDAQKHIQEIFTIV